MKRTILFGKYLVAMGVATVIFTGCKKEVGYHDSSPIINTTNLTTYDYLRSKPGVYDSLLMLVDKLGIKKILTDSNVTLFAPQNSSFQIAVKNLNDIRKTLGQGPVYLGPLAAGGAGITVPKIRSKAKRDSAQLDTMVSMYIIRKQYVAGDFAIGDGQFIYSVRGGYPMHGQRLFADAEGMQGGGSEVIEFANTKRSLFIQKWSKTTTTSVNIKTKNGLVHLLRPDAAFGFDEYVSRISLVPPPPLAWDVKNDTLFAYWNPAQGYTDGNVSAGEVFRRCLDGSVLTKFISSENSTAGYFPNMYWVPKGGPKICNSYTMTTANDSKTNRDRDPRAFRIDATNDPNPIEISPKTGLLGPRKVRDSNGNELRDAATWTQLDIRQDIEWTTNYQQKIFDFTNSTPYRAYRVVILQTGLGTGNPNLFQISEWTMNYRDPNN